MTQHEQKVIAAFKEKFPNLHDVYSWAEESCACDGKPHDCEFLVEQFILNALRESRKEQQKDDIELATQVARNLSLQDMREGAYYVVSALSAVAPKEV